MTDEEQNRDRSELSKPSSAARSFCCCLIARPLRCTRSVLSLYIPVLAGRAIDGIASARQRGFRSHRDTCACNGIADLRACVGGVLQWVMNLREQPHRLQRRARAAFDAAFSAGCSTLPGGVSPTPTPTATSSAASRRTPEQFAGRTRFSASPSCSRASSPIAVTLGFMLTISPHPSRSPSSC